MARITWLADVLRAEGLTVREHAGWQTRGSAQFSAQGLVLHHTAGRTGSVHPSLGICINGRPGLPGPLCHVLVDREGVCHVIAAGRANHAGAGRWRHLSANSQVVGIEIEHSGSLTEPWTARVLDASMSAAAAICRRASIPPALVCLHKEWAPTRKIDPIGWHGPTTRDRIARLIDNPQEDDVLKRGDSGNHIATLQKRLNAEPAVSPKIAEDGQYGPATEAAVKQVQKHWGYPQTGTYGLAESERIAILTASRSLGAAIQGISTASGIDEADARRLIDDALDDLKIVRS